MDSPASAQQLLRVAAAAFGAFLAGSIPFGLIVGRLLFKADIRSSGSGNIGAANALRSFGKAGGATVLILDALKGFVPAFAVLSVSPPIWAGLTSAEFAAFAGLMAVCGHCYSPFLNFRGGKGVATWLGVVAALSWPVALAFVAMWLIAVLPTRWSSLGSLSATALSVAGLWLATHDTYITLCAGAAAALVFAKHRENIARLLAGRENKIGFGKASEA